MALNEDEEMEYVALEKRIGRLESSETDSKNYFLHLAELKEKQGDILMKGNGDPGTAYDDAFHSIANLFKSIVGWEVNGENLYYASKALKLGAKAITTYRFRLSNGLNETTAPVFFKIAKSYLSHVSSGPRERSWRHALATYRELMPFLNENDWPDARKLAKFTRRLDAILQSDFYPPEELA